MFELVILYLKHSENKIPRLKKKRWSSILFSNIIINIFVMIGFTIISSHHDFILWCVLLIVVCHLVLFLLTIVLSVLLRFKDFDYTFGILKLFLSLLPTPTDQIALCCIAFLVQSMLLLSGSTCLLLATCLSVYFLKSQVRACVSFLMVVWFDREQCLVSFNRYRYDKKYIWFYTGKFCFFGTGKVSFWNIMFI